MEKKERLKAAYQYLKNIGEVHTQQDVANIMHKNKANISAAFNGNSRFLTDNFLKDFNSIFGNIFSTEWLLTGEGEMLNNGNTSIIEVPPKEKTIKYFYDVDVSMGNIEFLNDPSQKYKEIIIPGYSDCKYAINAYGDSMHPLIKSGQIILLDDWRESFIAWGKIYLIVTKGGFRAIKYLFPSENNDMVKCVSENEKTNPPFDVPKEDIKLFIVKGWICRDEI